MERMPDNYGLYNVYTAEDYLRELIYYEEPPVAIIPRQRKLELDTSEEFSDD